METKIPCVSELSDSVPKIVITQPSPFVTNNTQSVTGAISSGKTAIAKDDKSAVGNGDPKDAHIVVQTVPATSKEDSEEFKPATDCIVCPVSVVSESQEEIPEPDIFHDGSLQGGLLDSCRRCLDSFSESKYMLVIQVLFLAVPLSSAYMGARYISECPLSKTTPMFLFMMGGAGLLTTFSRILLIVQKTLLPPQREWGLLRTIIVFSNLAVVLILCTEMVSFLQDSPSFVAGNPDYCNEVFYKYTYWMNWACLFLVISLLILNAPKCTMETFRPESIPGDLLPEVFSE